MACAYKSFNSGNSVRLICAYNARAGVVGEPIFESGNGICPEGTRCGDNGTCVSDLCRVPNPNPDVLLPIYTPSLQCSDSSLMSQFSRYYAVNLHNYYRRLIASGWAESKLTVFAPRASGMSALSYDCSLEKAAAENVEKCGNSFYKANKYSVATGGNTAFIRDISISQEAALEQASCCCANITSEDELQKNDVDPSYVWTDNSATANITNVMHDKYKTFGCAVNRCSTQGVTIVECRYSPKNMQTGDAIYDLGAPCSKCDNSEKCVFGVLCQK
ncbi:unnamed protein product [Nippostrongylus brasiliensis]|uniref:SCP domain-containing protein n=1 Tax=Nippostrongylus brasiliensis TaxID=27835 RepID=A0A0N4YDA4_NIPBR|nr:unnamed protein product [Nippostrongylus brasiliensis]